MFNFSGGQFCNAQWSPLGGGFNTLNIKGHTLDMSVMLFDVSNTGNIGGRSRMAGLDDVAGTINTFLDLDAPLYSAGVGVQPGARGVAAWGMGITLAGNKDIQTPMIVEKLHFQTTVDQALESSFDAKMDARVGLIVYPPV